MSLLLLSLLTTTFQLAAAQRRGLPQCSGRTQCQPPLNPDRWVSRIMASPGVTSAQLTWDLNPQALEYEVDFRLSASDVSIDLFGVEPLITSTDYTLEDLTPGTAYEALVCRPNRLNLSIEDPLGVPACGFCFVCFRTDEVRFIFETTSTSSLNDTHVSLTCQVNSNIDFGIEWSAISDGTSTGGSQRMRLVDRRRFNGQRVSIMNDANIVGVPDQIGVEYTVTSVLIAPSSVLQGDIECIASSAFRSQSSIPEAFLNQDSSPDISTIAIAVIVPLLFITCVVGVFSGLCIGWVVHRRRKYCNNKHGGSKSVTEPRKQGSSNDYVCDHELSREICAGNSPSEDARLNSLSGMISTSNTLQLPDDKIIDSSMLHISKVIGQGEFGVVYKALLRKGATDELVAVKSLKGIFVSEGDVQNTMKEIFQMRNFDHPNVMTLIGVSKDIAMSGGAPLIIMPYMARGSLLNYLRKERETLIPGADADVTQVGAIQKLLMQICLQISDGMAYLAKLRFIHRDLAARNCMIDGKGLIKVSDFGLTEDVYMKNYFRQTSQDTVVKLPLKWMAPESIKLGIFSEKSDVWSYGVTCWEVFSAGEIPYPGIHPQAVVQLLDNGQHLSRPRNQACCDSMYELMQSCWACRTEDRPEFGDLVSSLEKELTALADYIDLRMFAKDDI